MATLAEIEAAIAKAEKAGRTDLADQLRAYAAEMQPTVDEAKIRAAAERFRAAGDEASAQEVLSYLPSPAPAKPAATGPQAPPRAESPQDARQRRIDEFALFEAANPVLKGRYTPDTMPKAGDVVIGAGGGGRGGAGRYTVQPWQGARDTFGDTAAKMVEGPQAAIAAFTGGLTGGESPARNYLANDPLTRGLPGPVLTGLGAVGDFGGAALSTLGAGLAGAAGLVSELVPGQNAQAEGKLAGDLLGMSMFAVPELAGASSLAGRAAAAAQRVAERAAPAPRAVPQVAGDVAAAERLGIPVMRTDVIPPKTFIGGVAQKTGEAIPIAGTGAARARQQEARVAAAQNFAREYGADGVAPAIDEVAAGLLEKRSADLTKFTRQKREVIDDLADKGTVPTPRAVAAIDEQIAKLRKQNMAGLDPVIAKLEEFKTAIRDQGLNEIEANRAVIGQAFSGLDMGAIRTVGEKALSAVYGPLRDDMAAFIKAAGGVSALNKWGAANAKLSEMAGELGNTALRQALSKGEATPEAVRTLLFSAKPSDVRRLYGNLNEKGRAAARTAIVQEALSKAGGLESLSPDRFKQSLGKLGNQVGVFFKGEDFEAANGLLRALQLTERAGKAGVAPLTGVQNLPAVVTLLTSSMFGGSITATAAALGGIGGLARLYEATGVKAALRRMSKAESPAQQSQALQSLSKALTDAGAPASQGAAQAANSSAPPEYEALWGRY